ncbi:Mur ligase family protein, partial [Candidatus Zixiibacteriota bacterium]
MTGPEDVEIQSLVYDSRVVKPGALFVAVRGEHTDGHRHIPSALEAGAAAVVVDREGFRGDGTFIRVSDSRRALALLAAQWHGHPATQLRLVGITGTDGKTTTSFLIQALLQAAGHQAGLIGTVANYSADMEVSARYTTPEALELHQLLAQMVAEKNEFVVMEVSSHALALDRVFGLPFDMGVFTNLTRDHIDFHETFEKYRAVKALLFERL